MRFGATFLSFVLPFVVLANPLDSEAQPAERTSADVGLHKRFSDSRWTFYDVAIGACGEVEFPTEFAVALNSAQYGTGSNCFQNITMTYAGKTTTAVILDECPGCPYGDLDLSTGLFEFFSPGSVGVIYGEWSFIEDVPAGVVA